jgi:phage head maturation protease
MRLEGIDALPVEATEPPPALGETRTLAITGGLDTLSVRERRLGLRLLSYNVVTDSGYGPLLFEPGAFVSLKDGAVVPLDPRSVRLRMDHEDPPTGLGQSFDDRADAPYMEFAVAKTARGDEQLTLAIDGVSRGASVGYNELRGRTRTETRDGVRGVRVFPAASAVLYEVSTTWRPTFATAGVTYVMSQRGEVPVTETQEAPVAGAIDTAPIITAIRDGYDSISAALMSARNEETVERLLAQMSELSEQMRSNAATIPPAAPRPRPKLHHWVEYSLRRMRGDVMSPTELKTLALDDVITTEQPGLVPAAFTPDYDDLIGADRPFLNSTRRIEPPATGTTLTLPIITTRAVAGTQAGSAEKGALTTTATKVGTGTFAYQAVFGGADISIQFINRAERGFFEILTGDMAQAYGLDCESKAIAALIAGYTDSALVAHAPVDGGVLDPEDPQFGLAWQTSIVASKRAPTHVWLSSAAVAAFIDAKAPLTNAPLYSQLAAAFTAGGGAGGVLSGLTPVYVPALDAAAVDVIVGPSRGFVWAEDPARELRADVPEKAGRDIALAGGIFPAPRFAHAFTTYTIAS